LRRQHREATAAGFGLGTAAKYMPQAQASFWNLRRLQREATAAGIGLGTTIKYLPRITIRYLMN
jgi:hypothetical protein